MTKNFVKKLCRLPANILFNFDSEYVIEKAQPPGDIAPLLRICRKITNKDPAY